MFQRRCFDRLLAKDRTGFLTGSGIISRQLFFIFPVVFTSSKRFALQNVALASLPCASGSFGLNFASPPVVHLPFRNKSASAKGKVAVSGAGWDFCLSAPRSVWHARRRRGQVACRWITIGWREGNGKVTKIDA